MFGHIKHAVRGTAQLEGYEETGKKDASETTIRAQLMIQGEGVLPTTVESEIKVSNSEMPVSAGRTWNVEFDRDKPEHFKLLDDATPAANVVQVAPQQESGEVADLVKQAMSSDGTATHTVVNVSGTNITPQVLDLRGQDGQHIQEALSKVEQMYGIDLSATVAAAEQAAAAWRSQTAGTSPATSAADGTDETLSKLERLGNLHTSGVLTDAEFAAEKAKLLGEAPAADPTPAPAAEPPPPAS